MLKVFPSSLREPGKVRSSGGEKNPRKGPLFFIYCRPAKKRRGNVGLHHMPELGKGRGPPEQEGGKPWRTSCLERVQARSQEAQALEDHFEGRAVEGCPPKVGGGKPVALRMLSAVEPKGGEKEDVFIRIAQDKRSLATTKKEGSLKTAEWGKKRKYDRSDLRKTKGRKERYRIITKVIQETTGRRKGSEENVRWKNLDEEH